MKVPMSLAEGRALAERMVVLLAAYCTRIEVAGSVRRGKYTVGDVELVCIPRLMTDLLGVPTQPILDPVLRHLVEQGVLHQVKNGPKYKQFIVQPDGVQLDLYVSSPEEWGVRFLLSTGPAEFNKKIVTQRKYGGLLPSCYEVRGNRIWFKGTAMETLEEVDVFKLLGLRWLEPEERI